MVILMVTLMAILMKKVIVGGDVSEGRKVNNGDSCNIRADDIYTTNNTIRFNSTRYTRTVPKYTHTEVGRISYLKCCWMLCCDFFQRMIHIE